MAQGLVGVGGVPRNIAEIKVGAGGVRTVTEAYVGVGGAPRLCWSGNRWANKLYSTFSVQVDTVGCVNLYQIDMSSFAATFVHQFVEAYSTATGGGFKQLYRLGWNYEGFSAIDFNTWATVVYLDFLPNKPYSNPERKGAYLYYRHYQNDNIQILDANTYATTGTAWIGLKTTLSTCHMGTNSTGFYARGYFGTSEGIHRVDGIPDAPVRVLVHATNSLKGGWSFAVTDSHIFETEEATLETALLKKIDLNTGGVIQTGTTKIEKRAATNIFSPKKIK